MDFESREDRYRAGVARKQLAVPPSDEPAIDKPLAAARLADGLYRQIQAASGISLRS